MSAEEMLAVMLADAQHSSSSNPSCDLHEDEAECMLPDGAAAWHDQSGIWLKRELMANARRKRLFQGHGVYRKVPVSKCWEASGKDPIAVRWVDINKGDTVHPDFRSRLVAKEFRTDVRPDLYAATPPSECLRMFISQFASDPTTQLIYADVSRAYFYAKAVRSVYVQLPAEDFEEGNKRNCGEFVMSMHGIRDAACNWSAEYTATLLAIGYLQGRHNPCLLRHPKTDVSAIVHGDAFITLRNAESLLAMRKTLDKYRLKVEALGKSEGCAEEVEIFNKVVRRID